jgi:hypothetical protein
MKVKLGRKCFIKGKLYDAGSEIEWNGKLASWMTPLEAPVVKMGRPPKKQEDEK